MSGEEQDADVEEQHRFLDLAKQFEWDEVKRLVEAKPELVAVQPCGREGMKRWSALHQAAFNGNAKMVEYLLEKGADPDARTSEDKTPLEVAKGAVVKRLLKGLKEKEDDEAEKEDDDEEGGGDEEESEDDKDDEEEAPAEAEVEEPKAKKAKTSASAVCGVNLNLFLKKDAETFSLREIADQPVSVLQGMGELGLAALHHRKVQTVRDLATWKFYRIARGIVVLRGAEETGARDPTAEMNINKALDKAWEAKSLDDIVNAPVSALQGLTKKDDEHFAKVHVKSIADLGTWKFARWAEAICDLAPFENPEGKSR